MRLKSIAIGCFLMAATVFAQSDRGTLTGSITDPAGAAVPGAAVVAKGADTGSEYRATTTDTGNYTIPSLPAGPYELSVDVTGFRKHVQSGIHIQVAQTSRVDIALQVGSNTESVTVTADAPLIKTENAEQSMTISRQRLNELPINFAANGSVRNPLAFVQLVPGASVSGISGVRVNGLPSTSFKITVDGQDITSGNLSDRFDETQPSVEALQEFTLQTSNFSAEFGQVGGGLVNFTARSGTNDYHGAGYEYFNNEDLNAGIPFTNSGNGHLIRPRTRKNDFGGTVGGPVWIPKVYNGRNKTFFFFSYEMYREKAGVLGNITLPTDAMRNGDFSAIQTNRVLGTDIAGRQVLENTIYDPTTATTLPDGRVITNPFPGNIVPKTRMDSTSLKVQDLIPRSTTQALINNYTPIVLTPRINGLPVLKFDHLLTSKLRTSFYWGQEGTSRVSSSDGMPSPITARRDQAVYSDTYRLNGDYAVTPTVYAHAGIGYIRYFNPDSAPESVSTYDAQNGIGLKNVLDLGFPHITGIGSGSFGGYVNPLNGSNIGPTQRNQYWNDKATAIASVTWVRGSHAFKAGAEYKNDMWIIHSAINVAGNYNFSGADTAIPGQATTSIGGGQIGFGYASFLLGAVNGGSIGNAIIDQFRRPTYALYVQDTWKISSRLTLDYGLRWDLTPAVHELFYRTSAFAPNLANPSAGGLKGATAYEGYGTGRCNCTFTRAYPYAVAPRIGVAYRINEKTVLRGGWGFVYGQTAALNYPGSNWVSIGVGTNTLNFSESTFGTPVTAFSKGFQYNTADIFAVSLDPGIRPQPGTVNSPPAWIDPNGARPPRINQWSISLQRELTKNLVLETAYVGNRGVWLTSGDAGNAGMNDLNALSIGRLKAFGLDVTNANDRALLISNFNSGLPQARGFNIPYASFPKGQTLAQSLRPYPQFGTIQTLWSPLGNSWYDALQTKLTQRFSHGLDFTAAFTWQKEQDLGYDNQRGRGGQINDALNRDNNKYMNGASQPLVLVAGFTYDIPAPFRGSRVAKSALGGWTLGGILRYSSGSLIRVPGSQNNLNQLMLRAFSGTFVNRVPGQPVFLKDPNCHCIDPSTDAVLNPAAWSDPGAGAWGTAAAYYGDYRWQRQPDEQLSLGKTFRFTEHSNLSVRGEFFNVFNRMRLPGPSSGNITTPQTQANSGFGRMNPANPGTPRTGQLVARFQW